MLASALFSSALLRLAEATQLPPSALPDAAEPPIGLPPNQVLVHQGDASERCYVVQTGSLVALDGAREVHVFRPGDAASVRSLLFSEEPLPVGLAAGPQGASLLPISRHTYERVFKDAFPLAPGVARGRAVRAKSTRKTMRLDRDVAEFRGIRYGRAARFSLPELEAPSAAGLAHAYEFGPTCPQSTLGLFEAILPTPALRSRPAELVFADPAHPRTVAPPASEDCLFLNVWAPLNRHGETFPVMVFVHGGAFVTGAGSEPQYDGRELAAKGVVVVSLNYRLGALGFLAAAPGVPPNLGLHDQVCALRWVRAHIAHFGGRPGQVTAFGESAGAMSLGCLLGTELRRRENLFQACALMSGAAHLTLSQDQATLVRDAWFAALNLGSPDREALLALPVQALVAAAGKVALGKVAQQLKGKLMPWQPCVLENAERGTDALFEGVPPFVRIARGVASDVRVMAGVVDSEYTLFMLDGGWKRGVYKSGGDLPSSGEFRQGLADRLAKWCTGDVRFREVPDLAAKCARVAAFYVRGDGELTPDALEAAFERLHSVWLFDLPGDRLLRAHALTAGPRASFAYRVTLRSEVEALRSPHAMDLPLVFGTLDGPFGQLLVGGSPDARRVSRDMMRAFVRFAKNGDPGFAPFVAGHVQMFGPPPAGPPLGGATLFQSEQEREVWEWASHHVQLMPGVVGAGGGGGGKAAAKL